MAVQTPLRRCLWNESRRLGVDPGTRVHCGSAKNDNQHQSSNFSSLAEEAAKTGRRASSNSRQQKHEPGRWNSEGEGRTTAGKDGMDAARYMEDIRLSNGGDLRSMDSKRQTLSEQLSDTPIPPLLHFLLSSYNQLRQRALYQYYNWRTGTFSDLQLIFCINATLILTGTLFKWSVVDRLEPGDVPASGPTTLEQIWPDLYRVTLLTFGENFPPDTEHWEVQLYSVVMALVGVIGFALVLALTERIVMEVLEKNVEQGSVVFEQGHVLVLSQCVAGKDLEAIWRVLNQIVYAYAAEGGTTVVVLVLREKVAMENLFRTAIPDRMGSTIVFRHGSCLLPRNLEQVSVCVAKSVIVITDNSRAANEADAESIRCAVLIDELIAAHMEQMGPGKAKAYTRPHVVMEIMKKANKRAVELAVQMDVSIVMTRNVNAKRLARMVTAPVVASVSALLYDYRSNSQQFVMSFPELEGTACESLPYLFEDATVIGLFDSDANLIMNPNPGRTLEKDDSLLVLRPAFMAASKFKPQHDACAPSVGDWTPPVDVTVAPDMEAVVRIDAHAGSSNMASICSLVESGLRDCNRPVHVLVAGWGSQDFMEALLHEMDSGASSLPIGSTVVFLNTHDPKSSAFSAARAVLAECIHVKHVHACPMSARTYTEKINVADFNCALCLCDNKWIDPDADPSNGVDFMEQKDMLRLDSMLLLVQLHIRTSLNSRNLDDINIICEKLAIAGVTRFEDRFRMPRGISVNMTSFAAKVLVQSAVEPTFGKQLTEIMGSYRGLTVIDASLLCECGEAISWWQLVARAQKLRLVLFAFYDIPDLEGKKPLSLHSNPLFDRSKPIEWYHGGSPDRRQLLCWSPATSASAMSTVDFQCDNAKSHLIHLRGPQMQATDFVPNSKQVSPQPLVTNRQ